MRKKKEKRKMNFLYKTAFILLMLCIPLLVMSQVVAYGLDYPDQSVVFSASGCFLAFLGIIFAMCSKAKKPKERKKRRKKQEPTEAPEIIEADSRELSDVPETTAEALEEASGDVGLTDEKTVDNAPQS